MPAHEVLASERRYAERADTLRADVARASSWEERAPLLVQYGDACRFAGRIGESEDAFRRLLDEAGAEGSLAARCEARIGLDLVALDGRLAVSTSAWSGASAERERARVGADRRARPDPRSRRARGRARDRDAHERGAWLAEGCYLAEP